MQLTGLCKQRRTNNRSINKPTHFIIGHKKGSLCFFLGIGGAGAVEHNKTIYKDYFVFKEKQRIGVNTNVNIEIYLLRLANKYIHNWRSK